MKTICFVLPNFPAVSETFVTNQIIGAKNQGYQVSVLTSRLIALEQSTQRELIENHALLKDTIVLDYNIPKSKFKRLVVGFFIIIKYFRYWSKPLPISVKYRFLSLPFLIRFYHNFKHINVFHVQFAMGSIGIAEMKEIGLLQSKLITTFHGHDAHFKNEKELTFLKNTYKIVFKVSEYITVNTPYLETQVLALGSHKALLNVIPMAIDIAYFKPESLKELPVGWTVNLISIGRLIEFKGFDYAIQAIKRLVDKGLNVHYTIVGDGILFESLQDQIQTLQLTNYVTLVGKKSQDEIKTLLAMHHIYLMSSITNAKGRCETQGVVVAEAQAMGLPVVAFNSGGVPYTLCDGETGFLVAEKDVDAYTEAILNLMSDSKRYQTMSIQAREFVVKNFSKNLMSERFVSLYES